ncbi:serine proteinase stubble-like [Haliotis rufescens]|uniref:serine proteinase stubble-like n=1 Tax=Haliotis rufescens TaxID=6454 RepID=UPI001EB060CA|nr:serine proteinase stubble-like [Haliotis rufescens]
MLPRTVFQVLLLAYIASITNGQFNFCRLLQGQCQAICPAGSTTLFQAPILCPSRNYCCIQDRSQRTTTTTTTTRIPTTRTPYPVITECGIGLQSRIDVSSRIIGGSNAGRCEFPWMVYIYRENSPCGGSIIDSRHIVTAGHCLSNVAKSQLTITIGEYNTNEYRPKAEFVVRNYRIFIPSTYQSQYYRDDIAMIKLDEPIDFSRYECLTPICIPESWRRFSGVSCTVIGWGVTRTNYTYLNPPLSAILQKVDVDIVDNSICTQKFGTSYFRTTNYCAGILAGGRDSCGGDSGGPLMCSTMDRFGRRRFTLAGLVSTGSNCAEKDTPAIYTDVAQFRNWIDSILATP